jgi:glycosidase
MGADGFRLDAVPYLMEDNGKLAGSPGTHALLHDYEQYLRTVKPDVYTVGEVYDSLGAVLPYYPEQLDSYFAFEMADSIIAAVRSGSAKGLLAPVLRMQYDIPVNRWSSFLRNHDQPRTLTELGGEVAKAKLASFLLLTLPGVPFVYYGEEIGMTGTKPDERIRTPMQWSREHAGGFTTGTPWEPAQADSLTTNVEIEERDPTSLLTLYRTLIHIRATNPALSSGVLIPLNTSNDAVAAFLRRDGDRVMLVLANLGKREAKAVLLTSDAGAVPAGRWRLRNVLDEPLGTPLMVESDGRVRAYIPLSSLAPARGYLFELVR